MNVSGPVWRIEARPQDYTFYVTLTMNQEGGDISVQPGGGLYTIDQPMHLGDKVYRVRVNEDHGSPRATRSVPLSLTIGGQQINTTLLIARPALGWVVPSCNRVEGQPGTPLTVSGSVNNSIEFDQGTLRAPGGASSPVGLSGSNWTGSFIPTAAGTTTLTVSIQSKKPFKEGADPTVQEVTCTVTAVAAPPAAVTLTAAPSSDPVTSLYPTYNRSVNLVLPAGAAKSLSSGVTYPVSTADAARRGTFQVTNPTTNGYLGTLQLTSAAADDQLYVFDQAGAVAIYKLSVPVNENPEQPLVQVVHVNGGPATPFTWSNDVIRLRLRGKGLGSHLHLTLNGQKYPVEATNVGDILSLPITLPDLSGLDHLTFELGDKQQPALSRFDITVKENPTATALRQVVEIRTKDGRAYSIADYQNLPAEQRNDLGEVRIFIKPGAGGVRQHIIVSGQMNAFGVPAVQLPAQTLVTGKTGLSQISSRTKWPC
ncbi:MAG TPA: hypothetical protein VF647_13845 [Longimicrobium sp.]|jgi:hypothetical protein